MHKASVYSIFTNFSFDSIKNKLDCYGGKNCLERSGKNLNKYATKIINYEKKR